VAGQVLTIGKFVPRAGMARCHPKDSNMNLRNSISLIIYRFRERGLEVFLLNSEEGDVWDLPQGEIPVKEDNNMIALDPVEQEDGSRREAMAVEGDWHEIPSLKAMLYEDALMLKEKIKEIHPGAYYTLKDALKKVLPHQYEFLKELKEILADRNSIRDL
jgi:hypothetical protein